MQWTQNQYNQTFFKWGSASVPTYTNWAFNQPDIVTGSCIAMYKDDIVNTQYVAGEWLVSKCNYKNNYVCQKPLEQISVTTPSQDTGCPEGFTQYESKCFKINDAFLNFQEAEDYCVSRGGNLASISDRFEQYWMYQNLPEQATKWIGLSDRSYGSYAWTSKDKFTFSHWDRNMPDKDKGSCVAMEPSGFWVNRPCDSKFIRLDSFWSVYLRIYKLNDCSLTSVCMVRNMLWTTTTAPTTTTPPQCVNGWTERDGICHRAYKVTDNNKLNWYDANNYCQHIGGHLSSFRSLESLKDVLRGQSIWDTGIWNYVPFWIGLNKIDSDEGISNIYLLKINAYESTGV